MMIVIRPLHTLVKILLSTFYNVAYALEDMMFPIQLMLVYQTFKLSYYFSNK